MGLKMNGWLSNYTLCDDLGGEGEGPLAGNR